MCSYEFALRKVYDVFPQAYTMLRAAYVEQQKYNEAQAALQEAIQLDAKATGAYIELGATFNQMKNYPGVNGTHLLGSSARLPSPWY
jgi:tetratricopeptide (TPR) repeat protein